MKKTFKILACIVLALSFCATLFACGGASGNLVKNGTFEADQVGAITSPADFKAETLQAEDNTSASFRIGTYQEEKYFEFAHTKKAFSQLTQSINVAKRTAYRFTFDYKIDGTLSGSFGLNASVLEDESLFDKSVTTPTNDWDKYTLLLNTADCSTVNIAIRVGVPMSVSQDIAQSMSMGKVQVKNIRFEKYKADTTASVKYIGSSKSNLIENTDFIKRDAQNQPIIVDGQYELTGNADGAPTGWEFKKSDKHGNSEVSMGRYRLGETKINYTQIYAKNDSVWLEQTLKLQANRVYNVSFYYWIPSPADGGTGRLAFGDTQQIGLHGAFLDDPMYSGNGKNTNEETSPPQNAQESPWRVYSEYVYSNNVGSVKFGIRVGDLASRCTGVVRVSGISVKLYESDLTQAQQANLYYLSTYSGNGSSKAGGIVFTVLFSLLLIALILAAVWLLSIRPKQKKTALAFAGAAPLVGGPSVPAPVSEPKKPAPVNAAVTAVSAVDAATASGTIADDKPTPAESSAVTKDKSAAAQKAKAFFTSAGFLFAMIALVGLIIRLVLAVAIRGFRADIDDSFKWIAALKSDWGSFYTATGYQNPPIYLYVLSLVGSMINGAGLHSSSNLAVLLLKLPNILADVVIALFVFLLAKKYAGKIWALVCSGLMLLNPATFVTSAVWGGSDSFALMFCIAALYFLLNKKYLPVFVLYTMALMTKASMIFILPALAVYFVATYVVAIMRYNKNRNNGVSVSIKVRSAEYSVIWKFPLYLLLSLVMLYIVSLPFVAGEMGANFFYPITQFYWKGLFSQTIFCDNAFNMFGMLDRNLRSFGSSGAMLAINIVFGLLITALSILLYLKRRNRANLILICALSIMLVYTFMVNMNPRYYVQVLPILLLAFVCCKDRRLLTVFGAASLLSFINMASVLANAVYLNNMPSWLLSAATNYYYIGSASLTTADSPSIFLILFGLLSVALTVYTAYIAFDVIINNRVLPIKPVDKFSQFGTALKNTFAPEKRARKGGAASAKTRIKP